jgi:fatty-acyl-CoA synthase
VNPPTFVVAGRTARRALKDAGDRPLLLDVTGQKRAGAEIAARVARLAGALAERGLVGRRIGLVYRNGFAAFESSFAVEWLGATRVPVDPDVPAEEARAIFDAAGVDAVLADDEHASVIGGATLRHDDESPLAANPWTEEVTVAANAPLIVYPREVAGGQLFAVTTSYSNWEAILQINIELYQQGWYGPPVGLEDRALTMQQLMHGTGLVASFPFLVMGLPQVVTPRFDAEQVADLIQRHRITTTFAVPGMLTRLADVLGEGVDLPLRHTLYGGAPLGLDELRRVRRILGPSLVQLYGRFEAGWPLTVLGQSDHQAILEGDDQLGSSCGRSIPQVEIRLSEALGQPTGHGELQTRNPMVAPDYADPEGWCALGDVAHIDEAGYVYLHGRLDGMINTGSYHVYPRQVEEAIAKVAGVLRVRVTGEPDPVWGQAVTAHVTPQSGIDWEELVNRLRAELPSRLAKYKIPKRFIPVSQSPTAN